LREILGPGLLTAAILGALFFGRASATTEKTPCPGPADPIAIRSVRLSEDPIRAGTTVSGIVLATCNVAAVTAQVGTFRVGVPKTSPGVFRTTVDVPHFLWPGRFTLVVTAIRTDGAKVQTSLPIELRW
jgi:hypothetical protein